VRPPRASSATPWASWPSTRSFRSISAGTRQIPRFVEEALRIESPFRYQMRSVPEDTSLGGVDIRPTHAPAALSAPPTATTPSSNDRRGRPGTAVDPLGVRPGRGCAGGARAPVSTTRASMRQGAPTQLVDAAPNARAAAAQPFQSTSSGRSNSASSRLARRRAAGAWRRPGCRRRLGRCPRVRSASDSETATLSAAPPPRTSDLLGVPAEMLLKLRVLGQEAHGVADEARGGLTPGAQQRM